MKKSKNVLCISCMVGGGHVQAAKERVKQLRKKYSRLNLIEKDILIDLVNPLFGLPVTKFLNFVLKKNLTTIKSLIFRGQPISDYIVLSPWVFITTLTTLIKHDIDSVISSQPASLISILQATTLAEKILKKTISVEVIVSELPTNKTTSFFNPIKKLKPRYRDKISILSVKPYLLPSETDTTFWNRLCGITLSQVSYTSFPIRSEFLLPASQRIAKDKAISLSFYYPDRRDIDALTPFYNHGPLQVSKDSTHINVHLTPGTILTTIMLGSRPLEKALLQYIDAFGSMLSNKNLPYHHLVIPICSDTSSLVASTFKRLKKLAIDTLSSNLMVLPIPFQEAAHLAPLFLRSDASITRSGGMTSIELLRAFKGQIWIHSDLSFDKWREPSNREMPIWEIGNAEYLIKSKNARIINPSTLTKYYTKLIDTKEPIYS